MMWPHPLWTRSIVVRWWQKNTSFKSNYQGGITGPSYVHGQHGVWVQGLMATFEHMEHVFRLKKKRRKSTRMRWRHLGTDNTYTHTTLYSKMAGDDSGISEAAHFPERVSLASISRNKLRTFVHQHFLNRSTLYSPHPRSLLYLTNAVGHTY